jgi:chromosome partitioning protein
MILLFASGKGGVGKTTNAVQMAQQRAEDGRKVLLVDMDKQGNAALWSSLRMKAKITPAIPCITLLGEGVADQVRAQVDNYDDIVIDTRGTEAHNREMYEALTVADVVITPIRTSLFDSVTTVEMDQTIRMARSLNPTMTAFIMLNDVATHAKSKRDDQVRAALEKLKNYNGILKSQISHRTIFELVAEKGRSVTEFGGNLLAAAEVRALAAEVWA